MVKMEEVLVKKKHMMKEDMMEKHRLSFEASALGDESVITLRPKLAGKRVP